MLYCSRYDDALRCYSAFCRWIHEPLTPHHVTASPRWLSDGKRVFCHLSDKHRAATCSCGFYLTLQFLQPMLGRLFFCFIWNGRPQYTLWVKKDQLYFLFILCQMLADIQTSFTNGYSKEFTMYMSFSPLHLNYVAALRWSFLTHRVGEKSFNMKADEVSRDSQ